MRIYRYEQIAEELREQIRRREFERLPSERKLMARFGVQRDTIRRALSLLAEEGAISISDRRGAFVNAASEAQALSALSGVVLMVAPWHSASTAREGLLRGLSQSLEATPQLGLHFFDSRPRHGFTHYEMPDLEYLRGNDVRGAIVWPQTPPDVDALRKLRSLTPIVLVDRQVAGFEADSVGFDNIAGGQMMTEHLLARGHRRIGFLGDEAFAESVQHRWRGYTLALEAAGIPLDSAGVGLFHGMHDPANDAHLRLLLDAGGTPLTAVVCSNDSVAQLFLNFLRREGRRVPEDVAVTGYGDLQPNSNNALRLTTASQSFEELGRLAGGVLLSRLLPGDDSASPREAARIELPVRLIERASSNTSIP